MSWLTTWEHSLYWLTLVCPRGLCVVPYFLYLVYCSPGEHYNKARTLLQETCWWHLSAFTTWHLHICVSSYLAISQDPPYAHLHWHYLRFHHYQELSAMAHGHSRHTLHLCGMSSQNLYVALTLSNTSRSRWKLTFSNSITSIMTDLCSILCF